MQTKQNNTKQNKTKQSKNKITSSSSSWEKTMTREMKLKQKSMQNLYLFTYIDTYIHALRNTKAVTSSLGIIFLVVRIHKRKHK